MFRTALIASLLVSLGAAPALAQDYGNEGYEEGYGDEGKPPPPPPEEQWGEDETYEDDGSIRVVEQDSAEAQAMTAEEGRGVEAGGHILIPMFADRPDLQPGFGVQGRLGWEFPRGITVELNVGVQINRFDDPIFDDFLTAFWIGGGARYSFLNPSALVPFVGANLQVSIWSQCLDDGTGTCEGDFTSVGLGITPLAGVAWEISPQLALEAGLQATVTVFSEDSDLVFFGAADPVEVYFSPFLGGTAYF